MEEGVQVGVEEGVEEGVWLQELRVKVEELRSFFHSGGGFRLDFLFLFLVGFGLEGGDVDCDGKGWLKLDVDGMDGGVGVGVC